MPAQGTHGLSGGQVPDLQRLIIRAGDRVSAVGRHRHSIHKALVAHQRMDQMTVCQIPDLQRLDPRAGDRIAAVGS